MPLPENITGLSPAELAQLLVVQVWEANLLMRVLALHGVHVQADVVDRSEPGLLDRPEFHVRAGEASWPPSET